MRLFKNVDIVDLKSIMEKGILSMDASGNDNWESGKRAKNGTDVVYLFSPTGERNSFINYGAALVEVEVDAEKSELTDYDCNDGLYDEFICKEVAVENIVAIHIPELFKDRISTDLSGMNIDWCGISFDCYNWNERCYRPATEEERELMAKTADVDSTEQDHYFRGVRENLEVVDISNVKYIF